jgi:hypothetical protein
MLAWIELLLSIVLGVELFIYADFAKGCYYSFVNYDRRFMLKTKDKLLILDLDETLIYAAEIPLARSPDFLVYDYHLYKRPYYY